MGKKEKKDDIECDVCGKTYKSLSWYNKHMILTHPSSGIADVPPTATASSSAGGQSTDDTSSTDSIPSSSQPTTSSSSNPNEGDEDVTRLLPDEVLLSIFSYFDAPYLLDIFPLVCKRWCQLSKLPHAWIKVDLKVDTSPGVEELRIAKVAPYLRTLDLECVDTKWSPSPTMETLIRNLLRGRKGTKGLKNFHAFRVCTGIWQAHTKKIIRKFSSSLCKVKICFTSGVKISFTSGRSGEMYYDGVNDLLQIISTLPRLRYLVLDCHEMTFFNGYRGQLGKGCPALKRFQVIKCKASQDPVILDVLMKKKDQLVDVGFDSAISANVASALSECDGLKKCSIVLLDIPVVESMIQLKDLRIVLSHAQKCSSVIYDASFIDTINSLNVLTNISKLTLLSRVGTFQFDNLLKIVKLLAQKCKNVKTFKLVEIQLTSELFNYFLDNFQHLQELFLQFCEGVRSSQIKNLSALSSLHVVTLLVRYEDDIKPLKVACKKLRLSKPSIKLSLVNAANAYDDEYIDYGWPH